MTKLELLARIDKLSSVIHSEDLHRYHLDADNIEAMRESLDKLTEQYIESYCG